MHEGFVALSFAAQRGEQNDVADAGAVGQQHHQTVNANAAAAGGRHAVFQCADKVVVVEHGFVVAAVFCSYLGVEAGGLVFGVCLLYTSPSPRD